MEYSIGFALTETVRDAIALVPTPAWTSAVAADGQVRGHADVVEITGCSRRRCDLWITTEVGSNVVLCATPEGWTDHDAGAVPYPGDPLGREVDDSPDPRTADTAAGQDRDAMGQPGRDR